MYKYINNTLAYLFQSDFEEQLEMNDNEPFDISIEEIVSIAIVETYKGWKLTDFTYQNIGVLTYAVDGDWTCYYNNMCREIVPGDLMYYPAKTVRTTYTSDNFPAKFYAIKFKMHAVNSSTQQILDRLPVFLGNTKGPIVSQITKLAETWKGKRPGYVVLCKSILLDILSQLFINSILISNNEHYKNYLDPVFEAMEKDIQRNFTVPELAAIAKLSPSYFRAVFKEYTGFSPIQYQHYIKMSYALDLLRLNVYTVSKVAEMVGLSDYYFSRLFKKIIGLSPSRVSYDEKYIQAEIPIVSRSANS